MPHRYIITAVRATFNILIVNNIKSIITGAGRYLIIKKTLFALRKKFMITSNKRRHYGYKE